MIRTLTGSGRSRAPLTQRSRTIRARARNINAVDLAILTALNFADELERLRIEYRELLEKSTP